jgi:hypothetical protein
MIHTNHKLLLNKWIFIGIAFVTVAIFASVVSTIILIILIRKKLSKSFNFNTVTTTSYRLSKDVLSGEIEVTF